MTLFGAGIVCLRQWGRGLFVAARGKPVSDPSGTASAQADSCVAPTEACRPSTAAPDLREALLIRG
jgi:hypothetical protein